jgi:hypothetical protein
MDQTTMSFDEALAFLQEQESIAREQYDHAERYTCVMKEYHGDMVTLLAKVAKLKEKNGIAREELIVALRTAVEVGEAITRLGKQT